MRHAAVCRLCVISLYNHIDLCICQDFLFCKLHVQESVVTSKNTVSFNCPHWEKARKHDYGITMYHMVLYTANVGVLEGQGGWGDIANRNKKVTKTGWGYGCPSVSEVVYESIFMAFWTHSAQCIYCIKCSVNIFVNLEWSWSGITYMCSKTVKYLCISQDNLAWYKYKKHNLWLNHAIDQARE